MSPTGRPYDLSPFVPELVEIQGEVRDFFGWDESRDEESARDLLNRVESSFVQSWLRHNRAASLSRLFRRMVMRESEIAILGAAIEPQEVIDILETMAIIVSADGASGVFSELPKTLSERAWSRVSCVVSDADGGQGTIEAVKRAVPIVLHAHGDNRDDWRNLVELAESLPNPPELILTHQTSMEIPGMFNPGGFTDGDRAASFLTALGVKIGRIGIYGTRIDSVGRWSGSTDEPQKMEKLRWMEKSLRLQGLWND